MLTDRTVLVSAAASHAAAESTPTLGLSGGMGLVVFGLVAWALLSSRRRHSEARAIARAMRGGRGGVVKALGQVIGGGLRFVFRFIGGRELWGAPKSNAGFLRAGSVQERQGGGQPVAQLGSVAIAPARVSLTKRQPRKWPAWILRAVSVPVVAPTVRAVRVAARAVWAVLRALWPVLTAAHRMAAAWHRWPYAARGAARLAALAVAVGLYLPAWRPRTVEALAVVLVAVAVAAITGPAGLGWWHGRTVSDDEKYGPPLWAVLRADLDLSEQEPRQEWLSLSPDLQAADARITVRLPWHVRATELERATFNEIVNSRVPGEWVSKWHLMGEDHYAVWTHKPAPKPKPECPDLVNFFAPDIQAAIEQCKTGEVVIGKDEHGRIVTQRLDGETPHWALSVGTGGGKSAFCQMVIAQLIRQGYHIICTDVKRVSVSNFMGVPGVHIYNDPKNPQDMRRAIGWFQAEIDARYYLQEQEKDREFPGLLLVIEESNEFADISKQYWDEIRETGMPAADPVWGQVASSARLGRAVRGNILAVFQDLRDQALGGKGLRNLFRLKFMGNFNVNQWKNVIGTSPVPESVDKAGRIMIVEGNSHTWVQTCFGDPDMLREWALEHRQAQHFDPAAGLFGEPVKRSPERLPRLLEAVSRDTGEQGPEGASEGASEEETAGQSVTGTPGVTGDVTPGRDRLRLIPGQAEDDPTAAPRLLTLAEAARELEARGFEVKADTMRQHKRRRESTGFPVGVEIDGNEKFTLAQILTFYQRRGAI